MNTQRERANKNYIIPQKEKNHGISCDCGCCGETARENNRNGFFKSNLSVVLRLIVSFITLIISVIIANKEVSMGLQVFSALLCGYDLVLSCIKKILNANIFNENFLMLIAAIVAFIIGESEEGSLIIVLYRLGALLENVAIYSSRKKLDAISKMKVNVVHLVSKTGITDVLPEKVVVGSLIQVNKGERIPIDGVLLCGSSELDTMAITGESNYLTISSGDIVLSGAINVGESILVKTSKLYDESVCQKIVKLVDEAQDKKAKAQKFISSFAKIYTPIVCALALLIATIIPLIDNMNFTKWIYKALSFLVVSCPCALVISVPLAFFIGMGALAKKGILIKSSVVIENMADLKCVAFDKTGTLTYGSFDIVDIKTYNNFSNEIVIDYAATIERFSSHPVAKVIADYKNTNLIVENPLEIAGSGVKGIINGDNISVGNARFMVDCGVKVLQTKQNALSVYIAINGVLAGEISLKDKVKDNSKIAVEKLKSIGVNKTIILSGDKKIIADEVGYQVGVDKIYSQLLPHEKTSKLLEIKGENGKVAFVGDGINDSPSIASADVGIAMGGLGSDIAVESADVVILDDNLEKIPQALKHSKKISRVVKQNIFCSISVKLAVMLLSILIKLPMGIAMFADIGIMLIAVLNSFRCNRIKNS